MASDTDCTENAMPMRADEGVSPVEQITDDVENRLATLSDKITLFNTVLNDLKDLSDVLVRKSLQGVSLPLQK